MDHQEMNHEAMNDEQMNDEQMAVAAIRLGDLELLKEQIEQKHFYINTRCVFLDDEYTLLMLAVHLNNRDATSYLLTRPDINLDIERANGMTVFDMAIARGYRDIAGRIKRQACHIAGKGLEWMHISSFRVDLYRKRLSKDTVAEWIYLNRHCRMCGRPCVTSTNSLSLPLSRARETGTTCRECLRPRYCHRGCRSRHASQHKRKHCSQYFKIPLGTTPFGVRIEWSAIRCDPAQWEEIKTLFKRKWARLVHPDRIICTSSLYLSINITLCHLALLQGDYTFFRRLVDYGASADTACRDMLAGHVGTRWAREWDHVQLGSGEIVERLDFLASWGLVTMIPCIRFGQICGKEVIKWFLDQGCDPNMFLSGKVLIQHVMNFPSDEKKCLLSDLVDYGFDFDIPLSPGSKCRHVDMLRVPYPFIDEWRQRAEKEKTISRSILLDCLGKDLLTIVLSYDNRLGQ